MAKRKGGEIPLSAIEKVMKKAGIKRASEGAKKLLRDYLEEIGMEISEKAIKLAEHGKRVTIRPEDIKLVSR